MEPAEIFQALLNLSDKKLIDYLQKLKGSDLRTINGRMAYLNQICRGITEQKIIREPIIKHSDNDIEDKYCDLKMVAKILDRKKSHIETLISKGTITPLPHEVGTKRRFIKADIINYVERLSKKSQ